MGFPAGDTATETIVATKSRERVGGSRPNRLLSRQPKQVGNATTYASHHVQTNSCFR